MIQWRTTDSVLVVGIVLVGAGLFFSNGSRAIATAASPIVVASGANKPAASATGSVAGSAPPATFLQVSEEQAPAAYEAKFNNDTMDAQWADRTERALRTHFHSLTLEAATSINVVECRSTMCKVTAHFPNNAERQAFVQHAFIDPDAHFQDLHLATYSPPPEQAGQAVLGTTYLIKATRREPPAKDASIPVR
jgi:hypothetical protein